jgi:arylsulfatase A-like enzyme
MRWPGKIPQNKVSDAIFATIDFLPTFAHLAGFKVPVDRVIDGVDQCDLLFGNSKEGARSTFFYQGNGIRQGKWKYLKAIHDIPGYARDEEREEVEELYDLETDVGETTNLAKKYPEKVMELRALMQKIVEGKK